MAGEVRRVDDFFKFLNEFLANIRPDDPLPVRAPSYKVTENEIDGQILDIVHHYLNGKDCPVFVRSYVAHKVWEHMRQPTLHCGDGAGSDGNAGDSDGDTDEDGDDVMDSAAPTNSTYEAMKLIREVTTKANDVIRDMTRTFTPEKVANTPDYLPVSSFAIKNNRRKMEDRHIILRDLNTLYDMEYGQPHAFYGVFDGHAGSDAAVYSAAHLHQYLIQNPLYHMDPIAALRHAFHFADTNFLKKAKKERLKGGTTALVALIRDNRLAVAWLGDSLAVLVRKRQPIQLVEPHKPDNQSERDRVNSLGGCVVKLEGSWRILGQLAISRAIGDADYKPFVSSECDVKTLEMVGDEDFLILATDGLWDTITYEEAVTFVYAYLTINQGDSEGVGRCLVEQARRQGSHDNITAVVIFLRPVDVLMEEEAARRQAGEIPESEMDPSCLMKKDSAPSTIYEIFSNNVGTFNPDSPSNKQVGEDYNPFSPDSSATGAAIGNGQPLNGGDAPTPNFYGQAAGEEYDLSAGLPISNTPDPTIEDVESALAELDSLPDGDNDRDTPEDDWQRYGDMDSSSNQTEEMAAVNYQQQEQEHAMRQESPLVADSPDPYKSEPMDVPQSNGGGSPHSGGSPSGSPRSVEGFVTSVELNTAQEQLASSTTNAVAADVDATPLEQQSGPFSVYVSSSPEPASLDALVDTSVQKVVSPQPSGDYEMQDSAINSESIGQASPSPVAFEADQQSNVFEQPPSPVVEETSSVEIVHAQSMVEVVAPPSPTHEPELQFVTSQPLETEPVPSPVYTPAPLNDMMSNDLMSTSMILEQPISDAPEQVEQMMQFVTSNTEVVYNNLEQQQTAEVVHITSESDRLMSPEVESDRLVSPEVESDRLMSPEVESDRLMSPEVESDKLMSPEVESNRLMSPEVESGNLLDVEDSEASYPASSPAPAAISPVAAQPLAESPMSPQSGGDDSLVEQMNRANINDSHNAPSEQIVAPSEPVEFVPSPVQEEPVQADLLTPTVEAVPEQQPQIAEPCEERQSPVPSPIQTDQTPLSDVMPSTPIKEPMIGNRPISPIHTPKADIPVHDSEILSEIAALPPAEKKQIAAVDKKENVPAKKAPVKPTPRTTTAATTRSRPTASAVASSKTTPTTSNVKPGTPRPTARATPAARAAPGGAVRSSATTTTTKTTTRATPATRTPTARTTPSSRSTSATSTSTTRTTTTRTPLSRNATPSATRTTPSSSATRPSTATGSANRPTPTTRTSRPTTTPTSTLKTTTTRTTPRSASRPTSAATTPTTTRRGLTSSTTTTTTVRRTLASASAAAKDSTDSKTSTTTTRAPYTRKPLYPGPAPKTTAAGAKSTADKDVKNSTNKMLSSRTSTLSRSTAGTTASRTATTMAPTHRGPASKTTSTTGPAKRVGGTTSTLKSRTTTTTTKTGLKAKSPVITANSNDKKEIPSPETNGEVKIAQEETSVEVVTKEQNEEIVEVNGQEAVVTTTTTTTEVLVNGDGEH